MYPEQLEEVQEKGFQALFYVSAWIEGTLLFSHFWGSQWLYSCGGVHVYVAVNSFKPFCTLEIPKYIGAFLLTKNDC